MNSFHNDDLLQRPLILYLMAVLVVYGNNAPLVDEDIDAMRAAVGSYMVARVTCNLAHLVFSFASYQHRRQQRLWVGLSTICLRIDIPLYFEEVLIRAEIAAAAVAASLEEITWVFCYCLAAKKLLCVKYSPAVDVAQEVDRFVAFYILVLGEFLYRIIQGSNAAVGLNERLLRAVWTLVIAFCLNWLYIHADRSIESMHPLRHNAYTGKLLYILL